MTRELRWYRCIEVQRYTDTVVQRYRGRQIQRYRGTQRQRGTEVQKFKSTEVERYKVHRCPAGVGTKPTQGCASFPSRASALHSDPNSSKLSIHHPPNEQTALLQLYNGGNTTCRWFSEERNRKRTKSLYSHFCQLCICFVQTIGITTASHLSP